MFASPGDLDQLAVPGHAITEFHSVDYRAISQGLDTLSNFSCLSPDRTYTFTAANHGGRPQSEEHMCGMHLGADLMSVIADPSTVKPWHAA